MSCYFLLDAGYCKLCNCGLDFYYSLLYSFQEFFSARQLFLFSLILLSLALGCLQHQLFSGTNSAHCRGAAFLGFLSLWHGRSLTEASPVRPWGLPTAPVVLAQPRGVAPCEHSAHLPRGPLPSALKPFLSSAPPPPSQLVCLLNSVWPVRGPHPHPCGALRRSQASLTCPLPSGVTGFHRLPPHT